MTVVDMLGRVDKLADAMGGSVDAVTGAAIGPYRKSRRRRLPPAPPTLASMRPLLEALLIVAGAVGVAVTDRGAVLHR